MCEGTVSAGKATFVLLEALFITFQMVEVCVCGWQDAMTTTEADVQEMLSCGHVFSRAPNSSRISRLAHNVTPKPPPSQHCAPSARSYQPTSHTMAHLVLRLVLVGLLVTTASCWRQDRKPTLRRHLLAPLTVNGAR